MGDAQGFTLFCGLDNSQRPHGETCVKKEGYTQDGGEKGDYHAEGPMEKITAKTVSSPDEEEGYITTG